MGLSLIFFGTPAFAVPSLEALFSSSHRVLAVVTGPDRPAGRGRRVQASPVAEAVGDRVAVLKPESVNSPDARATLEDIRADLFVVVAYGQILSPALLEVPRRGAVNLHASLLPRFRGPAPIVAAILAGVSETGVTTLWMTPEVDAGDIILERAVAIGPEETTGELEERLATLGAAVLAETVDRISAGTVPRRPQDHAAATSAPKLSRANFQIDWDDPPDAIVRLLRAGMPHIPAWTAFRGERVQILTGREPAWPRAGEAGEVMAVEKDSIVVAASGGGVVLLEVRAAGGKRMTAGEYARGRRIRVGDRFGPLEGGAS